MVIAICVSPASSSLGKLFLIVFDCHCHFHSSRFLFFLCCFLYPGRDFVSLSHRAFWRRVGNTCAVYYLDQPGVWKRWKQSLPEQEVRNVAAAAATLPSHTRVFREEDGQWKEEQKLEAHSDWVRDVAWAPSIGLPTSTIASCSQVRPLSERHLLCVVLYACLAFSYSKSTGSLPCWATARADAPRVHAGVVIWSAALSAVKVAVSVLWLGSNQLSLLAFVGRQSVYLDVRWCLWKLMVTKAAAQVQWCCLACELVHYCKYPCSVWRRQQSEYFGLAVLLHAISMLVVLLVKTVVGSPLLQWWMFFLFDLSRGEEDPTLWQTSCTAFLLLAGNEKCRLNFIL